jgi:hypothetical protein
VVTCLVWVLGVLFVAFLVLTLSACSNTLGCITVIAAFVLGGPLGFIAIIGVGLLNLFKGRDKKRGKKQEVHKVGW